MIGVAVHSTERDVAAEFFQLFKTPWEFYRSDRRYEVLICTHDQFARNAAKLVLFYNAGATQFDAEKRIPIRSRQGGTTITHEGKRIPIYGNIGTFSANPFSALKDEATQEAVACISSEGTALRIGYDLFREVRSLLSRGQPAANARTATLEMHIEFLRKVITSSGIPLVEIPPVPAGYNFTACLTHDVDHPRVRNHWCDHTMFGFLYRATVGSLISVCRGRKPAKALAVNWTAASTLPLVYLGMAKDFWREFDRYVELEAGLGSTYFVIPEKDYPGRQTNGSGSPMRAARYDLADIKPQLEKVISAGCEVGLHGMDAWLDSAAGREEQERVSRVVGPTQRGVRMHWLFFDEKSPAILDQAGFSYDSTVGYNETVGYRAGTAQAFKPLEAANLLELPLHVMDTALFHPGHLNLSEAEAKRVVWQLIDDVARFGGALTINWHDRSIAPERLWDGFYLGLLHELKGRGAWFPTAAQAVSWFRKRRSAVVEAVREETGTLKVRASVNADRDLPGLRVRVHKPEARGLCATTPGEASTAFVDISFKENIETAITF